MVRFLVETEQSYVESLKVILKVSKVICRNVVGWTDTIHSSAPRGRALWLRQFEVLRSRKGWRGGRGGGGAASSWSEGEQLEGLCAMGGCREVMQ